MPDIELTDHMISMLEMALNDNSYMGSWYFDKQENEVTFITEYDELEEEEELKQLIEEDEDGERFIYIEPAPGSENWQVMEDFILQQNDLDDTVQTLLLRAIQGSGAFRRFGDAIDDVGIRDRWYAYKNRLERERALQWLKDHELISDAGVAKGLKMLEDVIARRERIEKGQQGMTKGAQVVCVETVGHSDKITPGKAYKILDDRPDDLLIRIEDDRGKIVWLPKSHFEMV
ncbi:MAG: hypothetical protein EA391_14070 [Balneolaceae bacterium]|nr:MAG: hypothetical protein EA391_14070 [Balneolaceae bacterium]